VRDLKPTRQARVKGNRRKRTRQPRDWKKFFHRMLRVGVTLASVALVGSGCFFTGRLLLDSHLFKVTSVRVEGAHRVSEADIRALSEIKTGTSMVGLNLGRIGRKIEKNAWIAHAAVERVWPREVVIRVTEHQPKAIINLGYLYYLDGSGAIFKLLGPKDSLNYPVITGIDRRLLLDHPERAHDEIMDALEVMGDLTGRKRFNLKDVSELHFDAAEGLELYTYIGGVPVRLGFGNYGKKLNRLERIYRQLAPRLVALRYIDLNVDGRVIVMLDAKHSHGKG
jgi:cell division protein FtsQ